MEQILSSILVVPLSFTLIGFCFVVHFCCLAGTNPIDPSSYGSAPQVSRSRKLPERLKMMPEHSGTYYSVGEQCMYISKHVSRHIQSDEGKAGLRPPALRA